MRPSIAIMAAGLGTRMKSNTPKVLHKISGDSMLNHILKEAQLISDDIHVILFHHSEHIAKELHDKFTGIHIVIQDHHKFPGTGGAIRGIKPKYNKILVLSGDMPLLEASDMRLLFNNDEEVVMGAFHLDNPAGYGRVVIDASLKVEKIVEEKDATTEEKNIDLVNAGAYSFNTHFLSSMLPKLSNDNAQKEYYITDLVALANASGNRVKAVVVSEKRFMGVNTKADLARAEVFMQNRIKTRFMRDKGVIMRLPETIYIESGVRIDGESIIENGVNLLGTTHIQNSHIKANTIVESSTIIDSIVGPIARIRPHSLIKNSQIGNFVEIKKSTLTGVKAAHLSYLGDAIIGEGTNIGCGTITCNYNGIEKNQTIIGKNVFIGSDTQFIAPITVEDDAIIAAGTTVTKNVPKGSLAISRAPMKFIDGYFYKYFEKTVK